MKILGFELQDLLLVMIFASIMNVLCSGTFLYFYMTYLLPALAALVLLFIKRNNPDGYLIHLIRFYLRPGVFSAGATPKNYSKLQSKFIKEENHDSKRK